MHESLKQKNYVVVREQYVIYTYSNVVRLKSSGEAYVTKWKKN
jgi:hypothetical protein